MVPFAEVIADRAADLIIAVRTFGSLYVLDLTLTTSSPLCSSGFSPASSPRYSTPFIATLSVWQDAKEDELGVGQSLSSTLETEVYNALDVNNPTLTLFKPPWTETDAEDGGVVNVTRPPAHSVSWYPAISTIVEDSHSITVPNMVCVKGYWIGAAVIAGAVVVGIVGAMVQGQGSQALPVFVPLEDHNVSSLLY